MDETQASTVCELCLAEVPLDTMEVYAEKNRADDSGNVWTDPTTVRLTYVCTCGWSRRYIKIMDPDEEAATYSDAEKFDR